MALKGGFEAAPLPAVSAILPWPCGSSAASPRENIPCKILCPRAEPRSNTEPLPFPEIRLWECVCTCAHAKFEPKESFIPDLQPAEIILLWKQ